MWNLPAPPGFQGLRDDLPLRCYTRHMPHWRQPGATYFVTFRLADSLPQAKLRELRQLRAMASASASNRVNGRTSSPSYDGHGPGANERMMQDRQCYESMRRVEAWLDQGMGSCSLRDPLVADVVVNALGHFDGQRYELGCYVVMPNHVHAVVRPFDDSSLPLEKILQSWKGWTSRRVPADARSGREFWQDETFDRIVRDEEHLYRAVQYVGSNPRRANLPKDSCPRWIRPEWERLGWGFEESA
jgi:putative transposase